MSPTPKLGVTISILEKKVKLRIISCIEVASAGFERRSELTQWIAAVHVCTKLLRSGF